MRQTLDLDEMRQHLDTAVPFGRLFAMYAQEQKGLQDMTLFGRFRLQFGMVYPQATLEWLDLDCTA
jgi:hypothetical protein